MVGPTGQPKMGSTVTRGEVEATVEVRPRYRHRDNTIQLPSAIAGLREILWKRRPRRVPTSIQWDLCCGAERPSCLRAAVAIEAYTTRFQIFAAADPRCHA